MPLGLEADRNNVLTKHGYLHPRLDRRIMEQSISLLRRAILRTCHHATTMPPSCHHSLTIISLLHCDPISTVVKDLAAAWSHSLMLRLSLLIGSQKNPEQSCASFVKRSGKQGQATVQGEWLRVGVRTPFHYLGLRHVWGAAVSLLRVLRGMR